MNAQAEKVLLSVVVLAYNEAENLPLLVPEVLEQDPRLEVLVVDDNSPDGTGDVVWCCFPPGFLQNGPERVGVFCWSILEGVYGHPTPFAFRNIRAPEDTPFLPDDIQKVVLDLKCHAQVKTVFPQ